MTSSIIIPCYWATDELIQITADCIKSLQDYTPGWWKEMQLGGNELIVIDDGSPLNGDSRMPTDWGYWLRLEQNKGFPGAVNEGLRWAKGDVLIIANNDIVFTPGWLDELLKPLTLGYDISTILTTDCDGYETEDKITEGDKFGSLWAMKRAVYETLGGLDERFGKGTFEDLDYRQRAVEAGFRIGKNHLGLVEHLGRATFDRVDPEHRLFLENRVKYKDKHGFVE